MKARKVIYHAGLLLTTEVLLTTRATVKTGVAIQWIMTEVITGAVTKTEEVVLAPLKMTMISSETEAVIAEPKAGPMMPAETGLITTVNSGTAEGRVTGTGRMTITEIRAIIRKQIISGTGQQKTAKTCLTEINAARQATSKIGEADMIQQCLIMTATGAFRASVMAIRIPGAAREAAMEME